MTARFKYQKDPGEAFPLTFQFSPDLSTGETVATIVDVTVTVLIGTDPSPSAMLAGGNAIDSTQTMVSVPVTGGLNGVDYDFAAKVTTSLGKTLILAGRLSVRTQ